MAQGVSLAIIGKSLGHRSVQATQIYSRLGIYFWEHSPERAVQWARAKQEYESAQGRKFDPAVVGAVIQLGTCFDLTDVAYTARLREGYEVVRRVYRAEGWKLPVNRGRDPDLKARERDCLVVNIMLDELMAGIQTVRAAFWEGDRAFPGATFRKESHIQVAVRDKDCILGVFRPQLKEGR